MHSLVYELMPLAGLCCDEILVALHGGVCKDSIELISTRDNGMGLFLASHTHRVGIIST